jgi:iron-sulfur cluster repair protein YtfE (RIC family)
MGNPHSEESTRDVASPSGESDDEGRTHETSHVVQCMQCDLQFQADTVTVSHEGAQEEEEQLVRLRLPEGISPTQRAIAEQMYEHGGGGRTHMAPLTQPLREEHKELLPHIERLRTVADSIGMVPIESVRQGVDEVYTFLTHQLIPHAQAEERVLYPTVGRLMGAAEATATMSQEHTDIHRWTQELGTLRLHVSDVSLSESEEQALRRVLYGLYALVKGHFAKEEEIYLPLLDTRLTAQEAQQMFEAMEMAAQEAKSSVAP